MNYLKAITDDVCSAKGLTYTIWCSGCDWHCDGCFNPETWDSTKGQLFDEQAETNMFEELKKDHISGVVFTGGDPLNNANIEKIHKLCAEIRTFFPDKTIWIYTGYLWENLSEVKTKEDSDRLNTLLYIDVLIDGPFKKELKEYTLKFRGSSNQRVIDVQKSLQTKEVVLYSN